MGTLAITLLMLTAPEGTPVNPLCSRPLARGLAISMELMDKREARYIFVRDEDLASDLEIIRRRWAEFGDAPPDHDSVRFPDRNTINELLKFNREVREICQAKMASEPMYYWTLRNRVTQCDDLYRIYDLMREANCEYYYVTVRRKALKKLRDELGPAYWSGSWPPHVPVWRVE